MKKLLLTGAAVLAVSAFADPFETWTSETPDFRVHTGVDGGNDTYGYWWSYKDDAQSEITWPCALGNDYSDDALDPVIEMLGGVGGAYSLNGEAELGYKPFVGLGFNVAGAISDGVYYVADAAAWGGLCITYDVSTPATLELGVKANVADDNPYVSLNKGSGISKCFSWSEFKQAGWGVDKGGAAMKGDEAAKQLTQVKFKIQDADGTTGDVLIKSIGPKNEGAEATSAGGSGSGSESGSDAIVASSVAPVKAMLSGRTLSFSGISSAATVEVVNLQGRVVAKSAISASASLNLASLDAGIYMVRVAGKSVDFAQKIILK